MQENARQHNQSFTRAKPFQESLLGEIIKHCKIAKLARHHNLTSVFIVVVVVVVVFIVFVVVVFAVVVFVVVVFVFVVYIVVVFVFFCFVG